VPIARPPCSPIISSTTLGGLSGPEQWRLIGIRKCAVAGYISGKYAANLRGTFDFEWGRHFRLPIRFAD
jgi:hypothetical protein